ncbi:beta-N-acetylhexosaminidase [Roseibacillus persicicus]|uniref:beta-N-acetylhexosaminidase n=1 Tax=Roseibacillus persicicus TaxID=454148 RepID=A0A918WN31_9BACT|nr:beta-N-acetylhexosaminidase [Roseibacillus persicicus]GHC62082.1 hypothetical protein GCM10007100_31810 [Roseibacillus persicicus]
MTLSSQLASALFYLVLTSLAFSEVKLVPLPQTIKEGRGRFEITDQTRIVLGDESLRPLGEVLSRDLIRLVGENPIVATGERRAGDIVLTIDPGLKEEEYHLRIREQVFITGGNPSSLSYGVTSVLQLLAASEGVASLPFLQIEDHPDVPFRGVLLDLARQQHNVANLRHVIELCRFYKTRYLILHFGDDSAWTFPSEAFPTLGGAGHNQSYKGPAIKPFTKTEIEELVRFADARGVTLVPAIDVPGHSSAMRRAAKNEFDPAGIGVVNVATQSVYDNLEKLFAEAAALFPSSPYLHFGTDEVGLGKLFEVYQDDPWVKERKLKDAGELFTAFQEEMVLMIERLGKTPLAWEGHRPRKATPILKRMIWMNWAFGSYPAQDMLDDGYQVINASFAPTYVMEAGVDATTKDVYEWDLGKFANYPKLPRFMKEVNYREIRPKQDGLIGGCMCAWENPGWWQFHGLRYKLAAFSERTWNAYRSVPAADHWAARQKVNPLLDLIIPDLKEETPEWDYGSKDSVLEVYEGFADPDLSWESGVGFKRGTKWEFFQGEGKSKHLKRGLSYIDKNGKQLATSQGALELSCKEGSALFGRALDNPKLGGGGADFWVSFLISREGKNGGAGYWRMNRAGVDGSFGYERSTVLRHIRASGFIDQAKKSGEETLVVINLRPDYVSRVWLDPDLTNPGAPRLLGMRTNAGSMEDLMFFIDSAGGNRYRFDEFRVGNSFQAVTPVVGRDPEPEQPQQNENLLKPVDGFTYSPFYPEQWKEKGLPTGMTVWKGQKIAFLTMDDNHDPEVISRLVDKLDKGWGIYQDLIGREPRGFKNYEGLPTIAAIPEGMSCGAGCGFVGASGIELCLFYMRDYEQLKENPDSCPHYIFYEMGRNFYVFGEKFTYFATGFAVFMRYVCMDGTESEDLGLSEREEIEALEVNLGKKSNPMTFLEMFTSVGDQIRREKASEAGISSSQNTNHASVMLYLRKNYGGDEWVRKFYHTLPSADEFPVNTENAPYRQSLNWLVCASIAAGENLAPVFMERYKLPLTPKDQETLSKVDWTRKGLTISSVVKKLSDEEPSASSVNS